MDYHTEHVMTLANSIIGVSVLAMPYCFKQCGIILSLIMLLISNVITRLACHYLLKSANAARRKTFEFLAFHVFGAPGKFVIEVGMIGFLLGTCVAFFVVMGDLGPVIVTELTGAEVTSAIRCTVMMALALFCVLPLGLLRNVDSLSGVSKATIGFYCCLILKIIVESFPYLVNGDWINKVELWRPEGILQCIPIFSMALSCQTQLFEIYQVIPNATLNRMNSTIRVAVNICTCVYAFVGMFGYIAFYHVPFSGNILLSFRPSIITDIMKVGFVLSVAFSFPLVIFPCRASLHSLIYKRGYTHIEAPSVNFIPEGRFKLLTFLIVLVSLITGILIPNIELVLGLVGSTIGVMICVLFPVTCFICLSPINTNERILAQIMLCTGILVMVLGTYANLYAIEEMQPPADLMKVAVENIEKMSVEVPVEIASADKPVIQLKNEILDPIKKEPPISKSPPIMVVKEVRHEPPQPIEPLVSEDTKHEEQKPLNNIVKDQPVETVSEVANNIKKEKELPPPKLSPEINKVEAKENNIGKVDDDPDNKKEKLIETLEKHNQMQKELVEQQKQLIEVIKQQQELVKEKEHEIEKAKKENIEAVKEIQNIAQKAIESLSGKEKSAKNEEVVSQKNVNENEIGKKKFAEVIPAMAALDVTEKKAPNERGSLIKAENLVPLPVAVANNMTIFGKPKADIQERETNAADVQKSLMQNEFKIERIDNVNVNIKHEINVINPDSKITKNEETDVLKQRETVKDKESNDNESKKDDVPQIRRDILFKREKRDINEVCEGQSCKSSKETAELMLKVLKALTKPNVRISIDGVSLSNTGVKSGLRRSEAVT